MPSPNADFVAVAAAADRSLALKADGSIVGWGRNVAGETTPPSPNTGFVALATAAGGSHSLAVTSDGRIVAWGGKKTVPAPNTNFVAVAAGADHSLGLKADGSVVGWGGANTYGQTSVPAPNTNFIAVAAGYYHSLGLKSDGSIVAWGRNNYGQTTIPSTNAGFVAVAAGGYHSLGLKADGRVVAWGYNNSGQLSVPAPNRGFGQQDGIVPPKGPTGGGTTVSILGANLGDGTDVTNVSLCGEAAAIIAQSPRRLVVRTGAAPAPTSGAVVVHSASCGRVSRPEGFTYIALPAVATLGVSNVTATTAAGSGAVLSDGCDPVTERGLCWGTAPSPTLADTFAASGGGTGVFAGVALTGLAHGTVYHVRAWARNDAGVAYGADVPFRTSLGILASSGLRGTVSPKGLVEVADGGSVTFTITPEPGFQIADVRVDGVSVGTKNRYGFEDVTASHTISAVFRGIGAWRGADAMAAGYHHSLGLMSDGRIVAWGQNNYGQTNVPAPNADFVAVAAGADRSMGLKSDGRIVVWGRNISGETAVPSPNTNFVGMATAAGGSHTLALSPDGHVVAWGPNTYGQTNVPPPNVDFVAVAAGAEHSLGVKSDGRVLAWGRNTYDQTSVPAPNTNFIAVAAGYYHSLGLKSDGSIVAWGLNTSGQTSVPSPNADFVAVAAGGSHSLGLKSDGSIVAWGLNTSGQPTVPSPNADFVAVAGCDAHSLGLKSDGRIVAWGANGFGQTTVPAPNAGYGQQSGIAPPRGPTGGDTTVTILGWNLGNGADVTNVTVCGVEAALISQSPWAVVVRTGPAPAPGTGDVAVCSAGYGLMTRTNGYAYLVGPTVVTRPVTNTMARSAVGAGEVLTDVGGPVTERGLCWGTAPNPTVSDAVAKSGSGVGAFGGVTLANLSPSQQYHVRAWARNAVGLSYGADVSFQTMSGVASVLTRAVTNITAVSALGAGEVLSDGGDPVTERGVCWGPAPNPTVSDAVTKSGSGLGAFTGAAMANLTPCARYHVRAWARNAVGVAYGADVPFKTCSIITAAAGPYGTISPKGMVEVADGGSVTFTMTPDPGYQAALRVDGAWVGAANQYAFEDVTTNHTISATFCGIGAWHGANPLAAGYYHSLGLKSDGRIVAWGNNNYGQTSVPSPNADFVAVAAAADRSLALKADGSIVGWGRSFAGETTPPSPNTDFVALATAAGGAHSLGLKSDGRIVAWGKNTSGQTTVPLPNTNFIAVAAGVEYSLGLKSNGRIVAWGANAYGQTSVPSPNTNFIAVAAGYYHSLGLKSDGSIVAWGRNNYGQTTIPSTNAGFVAVAAGGYHSLGLKADGRVVAWGYNNSGQLSVPAPNADFVAVAGGDAHSLGLKSDGRIVAWGYNNSGQATVPSPNAGFGLQSGIVPCRGATNGGTTVAILGTNLGDGSDVTNVTICGVAATIITQSAWRVVVRTGAAPAQSNGNVVVYCANYGPITKTNGYTYCALPTVVTLGVSNITATKATGAGDVSSDGGDVVTERGLCWGTATNPTVSNAVARSGSGAGAFSGVTLANLSPSEQYHVRAWARNAVGLSYGADVSFQTMSGVASVLTRGVTNITATSALGAGELLSDGGEPETKRGLCWGTAPSPTLADAVAESGTGIGAFTGVALAGLQPDTWYHVRAWASNVVGMAYGEDVTFRTRLAVTASGRGPGTISPVGVIGVDDDGTASFSIAPRPGYRVAVRVDGVLIGATNRYVFEHVTSHHTISASFIGIGPWYGASPLAGAELFSLGLRSDGSVIGWGWADDWELDVPLPNVDYVALASAGIFSFGLKSDGHVESWGYNPWGQKNIPAPNRDFIAAAAGLCHSMLLKSDGRIVVWGGNTYGESTVPAPNADFLAIAVGLYHSIGLKFDGRIVAWGKNDQGQTDVPAPNAAFVAVAAGSYHSLGLKANGQIIGWGANNNGETTVPLPNADFVAVAAQSAYSLGLKSDGRIVAWGHNGCALTNVPSPNADFVAIGMCEGHALGLKADGSIVAWGCDYSSETHVPPPNAGFGQRSGVIPPSALRSGGTLVTILGSNLGNGTDVTNVTLCGVSATILTQSVWRVVVRAGSAPVASTGAVVVHSAGYGAISRTNAFTYLEAPPTLPAVATLGVTNITETSAVGAGEVLVDGGDVVTERGLCWGTAVNPTVTNAVAKSGSGLGVFAGVALTNLTSDSPYHVRAWARNGLGVAYGTDVPFTTRPRLIRLRSIGPWPGASVIDPGDYHSLALTPDGRVVAWGSNEHGQTDVPTPNADFVAVAAGSRHSLGLKADGRLVSWGIYGQDNVPFPNADFVAVAACGDLNTVALKADGRVVAWGDLSSVPSPNSGFVAVAVSWNFALGLKSDGRIVGWGQTSVPPPDTNFIAVAAGDPHALGLTSDGIIKAWGGNSYGQTDVPSPNTSFVGVAAGYGLSLGLKSDGRITAWGDNSVGQTTVPTPNSNFVAVATDFLHSLGLKKDGSIVAWGDNSYGQTTVPAPNAGFGRRACVSPDIGPTVGGTTVTILGVNLGDGSDITNVALCGVSATILTQSVWRVIVRTGPAPASCTGSVVVYSAGYGAISRTNSFTYFEAYTTNGTPHSWLVRYSLTNDLSDTDRDGYAEWAEYLTGSDPRNAASVFAIPPSRQQALPDNGGFVVRWPSIAERLYSVDRSTDLMFEPFLPLATNLPPTPPMNVYTDAAAGLSNAAYRVRVRQR